MVARVSRAAGADPLGPRGSDVSSRRRRRELVVDAHAGVDRAHPAFGHATGGQPRAAARRDPGWPRPGPAGRDHGTRGDRARPGRAMTRRPRDPQRAADGPKATRRQSIERSSKRGRADARGPALGARMAGAVVLLAVAVGWWLWAPSASRRGRDPALSASLMEQGFVLSRTWRLEEALVCFRRARDASPVDDWLTHYAIANTAAQLVSRSVVRAGLAVSATRSSIERVAL